MDRQELSDNSARHLMWISVTISMAFAIGFSVIVFFMVNNMSEIAENNKKNALELCITNNKNKVDTIDVWEFLFALNPNPTPEDQADIDAARAKILSVYRELPCP